MVVCLRPRSRQVVWTHSAGSGGTDTVGGLALDQDSLYLTGAAGDPIRFAEAAPLSSNALLLDLPDERLTSNQADALIHAFQD